MQAGADDQLFNYLCIRIQIDGLKKAPSPWQQASHSLHHGLSVCQPAESHPRGTRHRGGGKRRGGVTVSPSLRQFLQIFIVLSFFSSVTFNSPPPPPTCSLPLLSSLTSSHPDPLPSRRPPLLRQWRGQVTVTSPHDS